MDAPGIREELRNMARRIARHGYFCLLARHVLPARQLRFDVPRRDDSMMPGASCAAMSQPDQRQVMDDTAALLG